MCAQIGPYLLTGSFRKRRPQEFRISSALPGWPEEMRRQSVAVLGMRNGTSQSPFRPALGRQLVRAADAPLRGHGFGTSRLRQTPTTNGLTAYRMRLHLACVSSGTYGPFATSASRSRLRLPRTTRLALRASLAGSGGMVGPLEPPVSRNRSYGPRMEGDGDHHPAQHPTPGQALQLPGGARYPGGRDRRFHRVGLRYPIPMPPALF